MKCNIEILLITWSKYRDIFYFTSYVLNMFRTLIYPSSVPCDYSVELPHRSYCTQPHRNSNTYWTKNNTTNVVIQQNSRKVLMMDIFMSETCWALKKWNKIASDIKLVFYSSTFAILDSSRNTEAPTVSISFSEG